MVNVIEVTESNQKIRHVMTNIYYIVAKYEELVQKHIKL